MLNDNNLRLWLENQGKLIVKAFNEGSHFKLGLHAREISGRQKYSVAEEQALMLNWAELRNFPIFTLNPQTNVLSLIKGFLRVES